MMKTRIQSLMLPVLSLAAILIFTTACGKSASESPVSANNETKSVQTATVHTTPVTTQEVSASVQTTGSFAAQESSNVAPDSPGVIASTPVDVGSVVQAGQVIARLDDRDAKLRLEQALANQQQAEASVRQAQSKIGLGKAQAFDPNTVPEVLAARASSESAAAQAQANAARQQYEAAMNTARQNYQGVATQEASLQSFQAQVSLARKVLSDIDIKAPFAGYVSARPIAAGEYVATSATIATILRITPIKLMLQVPQLYAPNVKLGLNVEANVSGFADKIFKGRITAINPAVETNSRTFIVEAAFPNTDIALKPGMFATARIVLPGSTKGLFVPRNAVLTDATTNSSQVFMIVEGKARVAVVQIGEVLGDKIRILSGIPDDAVLAQDHLTDLYDGQSVTVN